MRNRHLLDLAPPILSLCVLITGCSEPPPEIGQVTGVVSVKGKPQKGLIVVFMPDPAQGNELPYNGSGQTDDLGKYELTYAHKGNEGAGAPVGWHRVILQDTRYGSIPQGQPLPPRLFSSDYSDPNSTPLKFEVKPGPQEIDIDVK